MGLSEFGSRNHAISTAFKNPTGPAKNLASTIGTMKWIWIVLTVLGVLGLTSQAGSDGSSVIGLAWVSGFVSIVGVYVVFGWFEHTLRMLIGVAENTSANPAETGPTGPTYASQH